MRARYGSASWPCDIWPCFLSAEAISSRASACFWPSLMAPANSCPVLSAAASIVSYSSRRACAGRSRAENHIYKLTYENDTEIAAVIAKTATSTPRFVFVIPSRQATKTRADCTPIDANRESQLDRYSRIPCSVVYQETVASKQLAMTKCTFCERAPTDTKRFLRSMDFLNPEKLGCELLVSAGLGCARVPPFWFRGAEYFPFLSGFGNRDFTFWTGSPGASVSCGPATVPRNVPADRMAATRDDALVWLDPFTIWLTCSRAERKASADWKRSSGFLASAVRITLFRAGGRTGLILMGGTG